VHAASGDSDPLCQSPFERCLTILVCELDVPQPTGMLIGKRGQAVTDLIEIARRQKPVRVEHLRVRNRSTHVITHQALIEPVVLASRVVQDPIVERRSLVPEACHLLSRPPASSVVQLA
jgi:hypothetical protein